MMPDGKHLFVSAGGAGYVIEASSRRLVETIGTEVAGVMRDEPMTLFVVDHGGRSLEAFDRTGRLWKADGISAGGFRRLRLAGRASSGKRGTGGGRTGWGLRCTSRRGKCGSPGERLGPIRKRRPCLRTP
jgi:hypothetical protein